MTRYKTIEICFFSSRLDGVIGLKKNFITHYFTKFIFMFWHVFLIKLRWKLEDYSDEEELSMKWKYLQN